MKLSKSLKMKNIIILIALMFLSVVSQAQKKLKLGFNTGTISPKALLETEARDGTKFFIDSTDGKVGIGVTAPNSRLVISGGDQTTATLDTRNNTVLNVSSTGSTIGSGGSLIFSANNGLWNFAGIKGLISSGGGNTLGHLAFSTRNVNADTTLTERMRILSNGNVGIGLTNPPSKLVVSGGDQITGNIDTRSNTNLNVSSTGNLVGSGGNLVFSANNGLWNFAAIKGYVNFGGGLSAGDMIFSNRRTISDTTLTENMRITQTGNVGIGTSSPISTLDVLGSFGANYVETSAATYAFTATDFTVRLTLAGTQSVALPQIGINPRRIIVIKNSTAFDKILTNNCYIDINGVCSFTVPAFTSLTLQHTDGVGWTVISKDLHPLIVSTSYPTVANVTPTGITSATASDYMSITLPSAGTWEINWAVRGVTNTSTNSGISSVLTTSANVVQPNSEVLSIYAQSGSFNTHATGHGSCIVTVSAAATYKIRVYAVGTASTAFATSDANGRSWVSAKRIQ